MIWVTRETVETDAKINKNNEKQIVSRQLDYTFKFITVFS